MAARIEVVIPCAGVGKRMKSLGPKAMVRVGDETVVARQIRILGECYPRARFTVVSGFQSGRLSQHLPDGVRVVENPDYETTNVARSIGLGLAATGPKNPVLVVYGDLVFDETAVSDLPLGVSSVVLETSAYRSGEVGATISDRTVSRFGYGLELRWAHICLLTPGAKAAFVSEAKKSRSRNMFGFEILNTLIDRGHEFRPVIRPDMQLVEVDRVADIQRARRLCHALA